MKSKAAIQVEPGEPLVIDEIDIPDPGPNQASSYARRNDRARR